MSAEATRWSVPGRREASAQPGANRGPSINAGSPRGRTLAYLLALLACLAMGIVESGKSIPEGAPPILLLAGASVAAAVLTALASSRVKRRPRIPGALAAGLAFALTLPQGAAVLPASVAMVFGWLVGREVFGRAERSFVHPAVLAHVFLTLTWPKAMGATSSWLPVAGQTLPPWSELLLLRPHGGAIGGASPLVCLVGAAVLLALGRIPWRILVAVPLGMAGALALLGGAGGQGPVFPLSSHLLLGGVAFGVVFLATDPHSSPSSNGGRWAHGLIIGFLIIVLRLANPASPDGTFAALLVASVFAPLADSVAMAGRRKWKGVRDA